MAPVTAAERFFCSDAARTRADPLAGTAPYGSVWVLIEHRGGWPPNGFDGLNLDPSTKGLVFSAAQSVRARVLLIRRPGRRGPEGPRRWAVLRHETPGACRQRWGTWSHDQDLTEIVDALATFDNLGAPGELGCPPVVLVCAHGQHDTCCAVRGRPVGRALGERWPNLVWECSHVGGDRFAANVVVAPDGVYYGNLDATSSVAVLEEHLADRINAKHLRGYTDLFPPQQAALSAVLERFGPAGRHDYEVVGTSREDNRWRIRFTGRPPHPTAIEVEVHSHRTPPCQLTCRGLSMSSAAVYEVTSIDTD